MTDQSEINHFSQISEEVFSLFELISKGESIEIDEKQCFQLQIISILLKNVEMFTKLDDLFNKKEDENFEKKISELKFFEMNLNSSEIWKRSNLIENI